MATKYPGTKQGTLKRRSKRATVAPRAGRLEAAKGTHSAGKNAATFLGQLLDPKNSLGKPAV